MISPSDADRLDAYLDGRLSVTEVAALEEELIADPDLAKALVERAYEAAALATWAAAPEPPAPARRRPRRAVLAAAALAVVCAGWLLHLAGRNGPPEPGPRGETVGVLTRTGGAVWGAGALAPAPGDEVPKGTLRLEAGVAQLEMRGGASVVIEGPADVELRTPDRVACRRGKLWVRLTAPPHDFRIETPTCTVADRGTEFGLEVDAAGATEVHVIEGAVEVTAGRPTTVGAGRGVWIGRGNDPERIEFRADEFLGARALDQLLAPAPGTPAERWPAHTRRLRTDPRVALYYPFDNPLPANGQIRNGAPQGPDGTVVGCRWAEGRWPDKSALEFRTAGDAVRLNVAEPLRSFSLAAWVRLDRLDRVYNGLLMGDGWDIGCLHWQLDWRGQLIVAARGEFQCVSPTIVTPDRLGRWMLLVATRDARTGTVTQYVNGRVVATARGDAGAPVHIGSASLGGWVPPADARNPVRTLDGRLDEFLIVRTALTGDEVRALYQAGRPDL